MSKPNVLLISTDHWPGKMIGALGHPTIQSPTIDQMVRNGIVFTNAYSTTPICIPARRELMTGVFSRTHGDRVFNETLPMPDLPTMAQTFRDAGYQAYGVGKFHISPPRNRIGFDDVLIHEAGRLGDRGDQMVEDDYEHFLTERGYPGLETQGGIHNTYEYKPWYLPEHLHYTNWTAREMSRFIVRRDRDRPGFWYMSFDAPHPPLVAPQSYMDIYSGLEIDEPFVGDWATDYAGMPFALKARPTWYREKALSSDVTRQIRAGFYALSTHIDHQVRSVIGLLKEQGILDNTVLMFTSDHGNMLGNHGLYNIALFYESCAKVPMVLVPTPAQVESTGPGRVDDRLVAHADIMPTLLDMCEIPVPPSVEGLSMVGGRTRDHLYGEFGEDSTASRMVVDGRHKLIYYPVGDRYQLFDLRTDPDEMRDIAAEPAYSQVKARMAALLLDNLYGTDLEWIENGELVGLPDMERTGEYDYSPTFGNARGYRIR